MYALVLAGGKGERLRPLTDTVPKPMAPVAGRPILEHQVQWLKEAGVENVVFLVGYRWEAIRAHFGDGSRFGVSVAYSIESSPLGRAGPSSKASRLRATAMIPWWWPTETLSPASRWGKSLSFTAIPQPAATAHAPPSWQSP